MCYGAAAQGNGWDHPGEVEDLDRYPRTHAGLNDLQGAGHDADVDGVPAGRSTASDLGVQQEFTAPALNSCRLRQAGYRAINAGWQRW
jgi:hypothetical protein